VPTLPGLDIALDEDRVQHFRRDRTRTTVGLAATTLA
jgi:muconate cycloisomerase